MANWDLRYTTYSLQFFGQSVFQHFLPVNGYVSPSLNIYFLSAMLMLFFEVVRSIGHFSHKGISKLGLPRLLTAMSLGYFAMSYIYGLEPRSSLISFNPDFAVSCVSIVGIYYAVFTFSLPSLTLALMIGLLLPFLKIIGLLASGVIVSTIVIRLFLIFQLHEAFAAHRAIHSRKISLAEPHLLNRACLLLLTFSFILVFTVLTSSFIMTGYFMPKVSLLGPLGNHAIPLSELTDFLRHELLFNRTKGFDISTANSIALASKPDDWFIYWRNGKEGRLLLGCLAISLASTVAYLFALFLHRSHLTSLNPEVTSNAESKDHVDCNNLFAQKVNRKNIIISHLSLSVMLSIAIAIGVFLGPPQSRFYTWVVGLAFYLPLSLVFLYPLLGFMFWGVISFAAMALFRSSVLLEKAPLPKKVNKVNYNWKRLEPPRWRTRSDSAGQGHQFVYSNIDEPADHGPGCWSSEPPCSSARASDYR